jgi:hypothetical protein
MMRVAGAAIVGVVPIWIVDDARAATAPARGRVVAAESSKVAGAGSLNAAPPRIGIGAGRGSFSAACTRARPNSAAV